MPHFAEINAENIVIRVIVADTIEWCRQVLGGKWIATSYTAKFGGQFAGIGDLWDEQNECFVSREDVNVVENNKGIK